MDTVSNPRFMSLPGAPEIRSEDLAGFGLGARLAQRSVVAGGEVPLLIKALGLPRRGVSRDARRMLVRLAGHDLGGEPGPWLEWWGRHLVAGRPLASCGDPHCALAC